VTDAKVSVTLKAGGEPPWVVLYGDNPVDAVALIQGATSQNLYAEAVAASQLLQGSYLAVQNGTPAAAAPPQGAPNYGAPAGVPPTASAPGPSATAPPADALFCPHGQRTKRSGTSARGPWTAHFCPLPKGNPSQCDAIWG
jgi:hypothetical protein